MNKRIRKKKQLGEFSWKGFELECVFAVALEEAALNELLDEFIAFIESLDLATGGTVNPQKISQYITKYSPMRRLRKGRVQFKQAHCTDEDRAKVEAWLRQRISIRSLTIGKLS